MKKLLNLIRRLFGTNTPESIVRPLSSITEQLRVLSNQHDTAMAENNEQIEALMKEIHRMKQEGEKALKIAQAIDKILEA